MKLYLVEGYYSGMDDEVTFMYGAFSLKDIALLVKRTLDDHVNSDEKIFIEEVDLDQPTKIYYETVED